MLTQKKDSEQDVLECAIQAVKLETGLQFSIFQQKTLLKNQQIDAIIRLEHFDKKLTVKIKKWAQQANLGALINQIKQLPNEGILVADYINPQMAEKLRQQEVQFIDSTGNAFINQSPVYVYVTNKKQKESTSQSAHNGAKRAFEPKGLMVTYAFLCIPQLLNAPYREIAQKTGVAIGTVGWVIKALTAGEFIRNIGGKNDRQIINYRKLLDRWAETWPESLKPKQFLGEFTATTPYWWETVDMNDFEGFWGGEIAAAKYTNYLKPAVATAYLPKHVCPNFLRQHRLKKATEWRADDQGAVLIYHPFWTKALSEAHNHQEDLTHPVLVYADLVATSDPRNLDVANLIYDKHLAQHFRKN